MSAGGMITFQEALAKVMAEARTLGSETVALPHLLNRVLCEPLSARHEQPAFDSSAVDGFGVSVADVAGASAGAPRRLNLIATVRAGDEPKVALRAGCAIKILTGAPVPPGVEAVVMREYCREAPGEVVVERGASPGENIRRKGAEFTSGQEVLPSGVAADPAVVGLAATLGYDALKVFRRPRLAVLSTGDELVAPGLPLAPAKIYDSNSYALAACASALGLDCLSLNAADDRQSTEKALRAALSQADVVISAGGVSVGDFDLVKDVAEQIGVETIFWRIAIKPGKPVYFGRWAGAGRECDGLFFGLPGNPVSCLVTFHQLVKPCLAKMSGLTAVANGTVQATLTSPLRKKAGRMEFVRAVLDTTSNTVTATGGQDSHMMGGIASANALIFFPLEAEAIEAGSTVSVQPLRWTLT